MAAADGDLKSVSALVESGRTCSHESGVCQSEWLQARDGHAGEQHTALMIAAKAGHADVVQVLLQCSKVNVRARDRVNGQTALAMAAAAGHEAVVAHFLGLPAVVVESQDNTGKTPLMLAAEGGHVGAVKLLIGAKADVAGRCPVDGETALTLAAKGGHECVVRFLLEAYADGNSACVVDGLTPLMKAARKGHRQVVQVLLHVGKVNVDSKRGKPAARAGPGKKPVEVHGGGGETALMMAVSGGCTDVVETLLGAAADVSIACADGRTDALTTALQLEDWAIARMLVETGRADIQRALMWGVRNESCLAVCWMASIGADVNKSEGGKADTTPLAVAAVAGYRDIVSLLITKGAEVQGPFVWAASDGYSEAVKLLHAEGAEVNRPAADGEYALVAARRMKRTSTVDYLVAVGADVSAQGPALSNPLLLPAGQNREAAGRSQVLFTFSNVK